MKTEFSEIFKGKNILITGGAGYIGSGIARLLLDYEPHTIRILDNNEYGLHRLERGGDKRFRYLLGDVRDIDRLKIAIKGVDYVFHAAALKHVPFCEFDPIDAIKTNVIGTQNVITTSIEEEVEKFILISTDKAVNPTSVMGTTKLLAEKLVNRANSYVGNRRTILSSVRFGNVLGSSGSVVPIFKELIDNDKPLEITHPNMTRFVMTLKDTVNLILKATVLARGGEIFILKMPSMKIEDLGYAMMEFYEKKLPFKSTGIRKGEKLHEELITSSEINYAYENDEMIVVSPYKPLYFKEFFVKDSYSSNMKHTLTRKEIIELLKEVI